MTEFSGIIFVTQGLNHEYRFAESSMQVSAFDIKLAKLQVVNCSISKEGA